MRNTSQAGTANSRSAARPQAVDDQRGAGRSRAALRQRREQKAAEQQLLRQRRTMTATITSTHQQRRPERPRAAIVRMNMLEPGETVIQGAAHGENEHDQQRAMRRQLERPGRGAASRRTGSAPRQPAAAARQRCASERSWPTHHLRQHSGRRERRRPSAGVAGCRSQVPMLAASASQATSSALAAAKLAKHGHQQLPGGRQGVARLDSGGAPEQRRGIASASCSTAATRCSATRKLPACVRHAAACSAVVAGTFFQALPPIFTVAGFVRLWR